MRVIAKRTLKLFWEKHKDCEQQSKTWYDETRDSDWRSPKDIKIIYPSASFIANNRVVFNIKGNTYRLIVKSITIAKWFGSGLLERMPNMIR